MLMIHTDTPRWYYARNRWGEGDAVLARLNDTPLDSEKVQNTRREILAAIEAELEANSSLHWKQFLTMGIVDNTRMKMLLASHDPRMDGQQLDRVLQ
jgi:hypothetical protein